MRFHHPLDLFALCGGGSGLDSLTVSSSISAAFFRPIARPRQPAITSNAPASISQCGNPNDCTRCIIPPSARLIGFYERKNLFRYFVKLDVTSAQLVGDVHSHVATPAFSSIEGDDADRIFILPIEQVADQRRAVSSCFVSLTPRPTETAEIVQH